MSSEAFRKGQQAAQHNRPVPHSQNFNERLEIANGKNSVNGK